MQKTVFEVFCEYLNIIYETGGSPHILVKWFKELPIHDSYLTNGPYGKCILLKLKTNSIANLELKDNKIVFDTRFSGVSHKLIIPIEQIISLRDVSGNLPELFFDHTPLKEVVADSEKEINKPIRQKPKLTIVK